MNIQALSAGVLYFAAVGGRQRPAAVVPAAGQVPALLAGEVLLAAAQVPLAAVQVLFSVGPVLVPVP